MTTPRRTCSPGAHAEACSSPPRSRGRSRPSRSRTASRRSRRASPRCTPARTLGRGSSASHRTPTMPSPTFHKILSHRRRRHPGPPRRRPRPPLRRPAARRPAVRCRRPRRHRLAPRRRRRRRPDPAPVLSGTAARRRSAAVLTTWSRRIGSRALVVLARLLNDRFHRCIRALLEAALGAVLRPGLQGICPRRQQTEIGPPRPAVSPGANGTSTW